MPKLSAEQMRVEQMADVVFTYGRENLRGWEPLRELADVNFNDHYWPGKCRATLYQADKGYIVIEDVGCSCYYHREDARMSFYPTLEQGCQHLARFREEHTFTGRPF